MKGEIGGVKSPGVEPKDLEVGHVRGPGERMPVIVMKGREGPPGVLKIEALLHNGVLGDVRGVVVVNKARMLKAVKGAEGEDEQARGYEHVSGGFAEFRG